MYGWKTKTHINVNKMAKRNKENKQQQQKLRLFTLSYSYMTYFRHLFMVSHNHFFFFFSFFLYSYLEIFKQNDFLVVAILKYLFLDFVFLKSLKSFSLCLTQNVHDTKKKPKWSYNVCAFSFLDKIIHTFR